MDFGFWVWVWVQTLDPDFLLNPTYFIQGRANIRALHRPDQQTPPGRQRHSDPRRLKAGQECQVLRAVPHQQPLESKGRPAPEMRNCFFFF